MKLLLFSILSFLGFVSIAQVNSFHIDSSKMDRQLMASLDTLYQNDQAIRVKLVASLRNKGSHNEIDSIRMTMHKQDSLNLIQLNYILSRYGWLGPQRVGVTGSQALFLVIQHADLLTQQKYLPVIRNAVKEGKTFSSNLAILEDRIAMRKGEKQIYGSQSFTNATGKKYTYPIEDPEHVDERRKVMGMQPMKEYLASMNNTWDLEEYKKMLPEIEKMAKLQKL